VSVRGAKRSWSLPRTICWLSPPRAAPAAKENKKGGALSRAALMFSGWCV